MLLVRQKKLNYCTTDFVGLNIIVINQIRDLVVPTFSVNRSGSFHIPPTAGLVKLGKINISTYYSH